MVEIESLSLKEPPIRHLLRCLKDERYSPFEIAVVMPTARGIRYLVQSIGGASPGPAALPYCFEVNEFAFRSLDSGGAGVVPDELRLLYLQRAISRLDIGKLARLFGREHGRYYTDFIRFASVGRRLLRFYEEVFTEGVGFEALRLNALYTDYERDVMILEEIASLYRATLKEDGLIDMMFLKGDLLTATPLPGRGRIFDPTFLSRFKKVYFLIVGRLTRFELRLLSEVAAMVDTKVLLYYEGPPGEGTKRVYQALNSGTPPADELPTAPYPTYIEVEEFDLVEEQIGFIRDSIRKSIEMGIRPEETVVVLPDESLKRALFAFDREGILNFAMGLDMKDTVLYSFLTAVEKMLSSRSDDGAYDTMAVLNFLRHPFIRGLAGEAYGPFVRDIKRRQRLFIAPEGICLTTELKEVCHRIEQLFGAEVFFSEFIDNIRNFMVWIMERNSSLIERLRESPEFAGSRKAFFERLFALGSLPFDRVWTGRSPLGHLVYLNEYLRKVTYPHTWGGPVTVMGMLETRALEFKAVIIPDMNEEFMPPASEKEMFLNTEIRRRVGLPTFLDREALSRAYFNGLLKKAGAVFLSHTRAEGRRPRSRFIEEIAMQGGQLTDSRKQSTTTSAQVAGSTVTPATSRLKTYIPVKDSYTIGLIGAMELTPTSLRTYRECRFRFYLRYVKKLREKEELAEELKRVDIGNIFHNAIKRVYSRYIGGEGQGEKNQVEAEGKSQVEAEGKSQVEAEEKNQVEAEEKNQVEAEGKSQVEAEGESQVEVEVEGESQVEVEAEGKSQVEAEVEGESQVEVEDPGEVCDALHPRGISCAFHGTGGASRERTYLFQLPDWEGLTTELKRELLREAEGYDIFRKSPHARFELDVFIEKLKDFVSSEKEVFEAGWRPGHLEFAVSMRLKGMRFRGKIDRVDVMPVESGPLRAVIIDYKVSDINVRERTVLNEEFKDFQLPLYRLMLKETLRGIDVEALAYYDLKRSFRLKRVFEDLTDAEFTGHIEEIVTELKDRGKGFERTDKEKNCKYCSYVDICW